MFECKLWHLRQELSAIGHPLDSRWKDYEMRKGFTRKPQRDEPATPGKNYITRSGLERLKDEHRFLFTRERPAVTEVVAWAAGNGDRGDYANSLCYDSLDSMLRYISTRLLHMVPVIWLVVSVVFLLIHLVPGDPIQQMPGEGAASTDVQAVRHAYGLDVPLPRQYVNYWKGVLRGDLGRSLRFDQPVKRVMLRC